jgi:hypothetical protein
LYELDVGASKYLPILREAVICTAMFGMDIEGCGLDFGAVIVGDDDDAYSSL